MKFLIGIVFLLFALNLSAQDYPDTGFTNKAEAKNLTVNGLKEGKWVEYVDTAKIDKHSSPNFFHNPHYILTYYKNGKADGIVRSYYMDGKIYFVVSYSNGEKNGIEKGYYDNGPLSYEVTYSNGKTITIKQYDGNGNEIK